MFERFTDRARRVVVISQDEARILNHDYIGTEHQLLALILEDEGVAAKALKSLGVSPDEVRDQVKQIVGLGEEPFQGRIPFSPRAKKVFELSLREALQLGHNYIGTEHILLGLIREGEGVAAQILVGRGCELTVVRRRVLDILSGNFVRITKESELLALLLETASENVRLARGRLFDVGELRDQAMLNDADAVQVGVSNEEWPSANYLALQQRLEDCEATVKEAEKLQELLTEFTKRR